MTQGIRNVEDALALLKTVLEDKNALWESGTIDADYEIVEAEIRRAVTALLEGIASEVEALEKPEWVEHGRDCLEGRRPCGATARPDPLADRCRVHPPQEATAKEAAAIIRNSLAK